VGDDDIEIYADESRRDVLLTWRGLRMQSVRPVVDGVRRPNRCLADFIAPKASGRDDYIGLFAVTAGIGVEKKERQFEADLDDYSAIMLKALADRLAEAFAESLHRRVRTDLWGYAADEGLSVAELVAERYRGIRPAPGYPACPDHGVKRELFKALGCADIGMSLTENLAMLPAASVSGFYFAHPEAAYFNVGKIGPDQLRDWARRSALAEDDAERALMPLL
jgi:5-methyltetrahydrofolate--homocysteine methyltransferase